MSNMSYCRFRNTLGDLTDCEGALEELFNGDSDPLSRAELAAAKALVRKSFEIVARFADALELETIDELVDAAEAGGGIGDHLDEWNSLAAQVQEEREAEEREEERSYQAAMRLHDQAEAEARAEARKVSA